MGRFDLKYPPEAIAELYRLVLDAEPQLSVSKALAEIARTHRVEIVVSTAYSYVQRERIRRSVEGSPLPDDKLEALGALARRWINLLDAETRRIERAAKRGSKPLDGDGLRGVARAAREALPVLERCGTSKPPGRGGPKSEDGVTARTDVPSPVVAQLLEAHEATRNERRISPASKSSRVQGDELDRENSEMPPEAQLQTYLDRKVGQQ